MCVVVLVLELLLFVFVNVDEVRFDEFLGVPQQPFDGTVVDETVVFGQDEGPVPQVLRIFQFVIPRH